MLLFTVCRLSVVLIAGVHVLIFLARSRAVHKSHSPNQTCTSLLFTVCRLCSSVSWGACFDFFWLDQGQCTKVTHLIELTLLRSALQLPALYFNPDFSTQHRQTDRDRDTHTHTHTHTLICS